MFTIVPSTAPLEEAIGTLGPLDGQAHVNEHLARRLQGQGVPTATAGVKTYRRHRLNAYENNEEELGDNIHGDEAWKLRDDNVVGSPITES